MLRYHFRYLDEPGGEDSWFHVRYLGEKREGEREKKKSEFRGRKTLSEKNLKKAKKLKKNKTLSSLTAALWRHGPGPGPLPDRPVRPRPGAVDCREKINPFLLSEFVVRAAAPDVEPGREVGGAARRIGHPCGGGCGERRPGAHGEVGLRDHEGAQSRGVVNGGLIVDKGSEV